MVWENRHRPTQLLKIFLTEISRRLSQRTQCHRRGPVFREEKHCSFLNPCMPWFCPNLRLEGKEGTSQYKETWQGHINYAGSYIVAVLNRTCKEFKNSRLIVGALTLAESDKCSSMWCGSYRFCQSCSSNSVGSQGFSWLSSHLGEVVLTLLSIYGRILAPENAQSSKIQRSC